MRTQRRWTRRLAVGAGAAALAVVGDAARRWYRFGRAGGERGRDLALDRFAPRYDVIERDRTRIAASPEVAWTAARSLTLGDSPIVRAIFRGRELLMGGDRPGSPAAAPEPLVEETLRLGWGVLEERPGRSIVLGAITEPWVANVRFRALPPDAFAAFAEPGHVKIVWNLAVDPDGEGGAIFRTETRAVATDAGSRARFRRYWVAVSPGIRAIRRESLRLVRRRAERLARAGA